MITLLPAVIYARVSSAKQVREGHGLQSQEVRCRDFAKNRGCDVVKVFFDDLTGKTSERPGMNAMLKFLRKHRDNPHIVIIDDISRLARNVEAHIRLRADITTASGLLESPNLAFGSGSDDRLIELIMATTAQWAREKNAEQVKHRMRARLQSGYWMFRAPLGYKSFEVKGHGKLIVPDQPFATIVKEALEGFAHGRFCSQAEVHSFLLSKPEIKQRYAKAKSPLKDIADFLTKQIYTGYFEYPDWDVGFMKGQHEPLISLETHRKI